jgi:hypothetical protein
MEKMTREIFQVWDRENTAYHEAGHAVAYLLSGLSIKSASITDDSIHLGFVDVPKRPLGVRDSVTTGIAGSVAEYRLRGIGPKQTTLEDVITELEDLNSVDFEEERKSDLSLVVETLSVSGWCQTPDSIVREINNEEIKMDDLLTEWWPEVKAIVEAMLEHTSVTMNEILGICPKLRKEHIRVKQLREENDVNH